MLVLDASAMLELLLKTTRAVRWAERLFERELHAPHLLDVEVMHALRRMAQANAITDIAAQRAFYGLKELPLFRHPHWPLLPQIWDLRLSLTAYDAAYVTLAETLNIPLFTCDAKLSRSHGHHAEIVFLE
jgi:predicted nucleic acid-binding protein